MSILILAAGSEIAQANVRLFLARGEKTLLAVRNMEACDRFMETLPVEQRANAVALRYDAFEDIKTPTHAEAFVERVLDFSRDTFGEEIHAVYVAQGVLISSCREHWAQELEACFFINFTSVAYFLESFAQRMERAGENGAKVGGAKRWIAVVASVAGDRGRFSNYPYGASKAALDAYLSGLRARLFPHKINLLTIKPGLTRTKMIRGLPQENSRTAVSPERVAKDIDRAIRKDRCVLYTPWFWRWILLFTRIIPESLFRRLKF
ncbi:MAG: SDR family NAD(P)-dependent oxidoreductase [Planctomycetia bacterium]|nr:SDR family NAD(P)-dependent oxidoreductase [Planctomycetia bacterium]